MHLPPAPDSRELLPPLLACLPTAFLSPRPPPALLPLLSPLLRQRVSLLSTAAGSTSSNSDSWLPLLSWHAERGQKLPEVVERMHLEPHPVSGEVEIDDVPPAKYRRLDEETLHARLEVEQFDILPTYLWCETDEHGGLAPGWRLAELRSLEGLDDRTQWFDSIIQANSAGPQPPSPAPAANTNGTNGNHHPQNADEDDNDDAYWAAYDRTPGRTPAPKHSPAPNSLPQFQGTSSRNPRAAENDYFARYGQVQPAMDAHDPDEEASAQSINSQTQPQPLQQTQSDPRPISRPTGTSLYPADSSTTTVQPFPTLAPRPISPASSHSSIEKLEARARAISDAQASSDDRAQVAIKQHISTDIKSLFRLARNTGMEREDFEEIVKKELQCLTLLERDD